MTAKQRLEIKIDNIRRHGGNVILTPNGIFTWKGQIVFDAFSKHADDFLKHKCRPFTAAENARVRQQKTRNRNRYARLAHTALYLELFESARRLCEKAEWATTEISDTASYWQRFYHYVG
jgi:hypothetical protein